MKKGEKSGRLVCSNCGNTHRFIEVMAEEAHIVDGKLNYIRLLEAVTDHYICCVCDQSLPANLAQNHRLSHTREHRQ
jgi:hypothetical protein